MPQEGRSVGRLYNVHAITEHVFQGAESVKPAWMH